MESASNLEMILKRDRWFVLAALAGVTALAWAYLVVMATDMDDMALGAIAMPTVEPWSALDFWLMFVMWAVMMVGMMLPSAAPMILLYAAVSRRQRGRGHVFAPTGVFAAGYLVAWTTFSLAATALQWAFEQAALLSPMMVSTSPCRRWGKRRDDCFRIGAGPLADLKNARITLDKPPCRAQTST